MDRYTKKFSKISIADIAAVGGKNASLGEMFSKLSSKGIPVPDGFATTAFAFQDFLTHNSLHIPLYELMQQLDKNNYSNLKETGQKARQLVLDSKLSQAFRQAIVLAYKNLCGDNYYEVAVRSSATPEEDKSKGKTRITPYWRVLKEGGNLNPKFPGGMKQQAKYLRQEGFYIIQGRTIKEKVVK